MASSGRCWASCRLLVSEASSLARATVAGRAFQSQAAGLQPVPVPVPVPLALPSASQPPRHLSALTSRRWAAQTSTPLSNVLRASRQTDPGRLAGAISHAFRVDPKAVVKVEGMGAEATYVAVLAMARGGRNLTKELENFGPASKLVAYVDKLQDGEGVEGGKINRTLFSVRVSPAKHPDLKELRYVQVARDSNLFKVAAFVAKTMQEGNPVAIRACGPAAVSQALKVVTATREFVGNDTADAPQGTPKDLVVHFKIRMMANTKEETDAGRWSRFREVVMTLHRAEKPPAGSM